MRVWPGGVRHSAKQIDISPQIMQAVDEAVVGAFELPAGSYEALVVCGHAGTFLSGVCCANRSLESDFGKAGLCTCTIGA